MLRVFLNGFKTVCSRSTHLYNNPWAYYFSGEHRLSLTFISFVFPKRIIIYRNYMFCVSRIKLLKLRGSPKKSLNEFSCTDHDIV